MRRLLSGQLQFESKRTTTVGPLKLSNQSAQSSWCRKIPGIVHQTSPDLLLNPAHHAAIHTFRDMNPGIEFRVWDDRAVESYMASSWGTHPIYKVFQGSKYGQMRADIFRYCVVFETGGFYLDINKTIDGSLSELLREPSDGLISFEKNLSIYFPSLTAAARLTCPHNVVLQWCFGFVPGHPILGKVINRIVEIAPFFSEIVFNRALGAVVGLTGPGSFTWAVHSYLAENKPGGLQQIPPDFDGRGITRLPKSEDAFSGTHYGAIKNAKILTLER